MYTLSNQEDEIRTRAEVENEIRELKIKVAKMEEMLEFYNASKLMWKFFVIIGGIIVGLATVWGMLGGHTLLGK